MIQDLHSHTYYSFCGKDSPEAIVEAAIAGGIELFGISDHSHGVGVCKRDAFFTTTEKYPYVYDERTFRRYFDHINLVREKYADKIKILRGIEVGAYLSIPKVALPADADISYFDYCLIENPDIEYSIIENRDIFRFRKRCACPTVGIAHTDMFKFIDDLGEDPYRYFKRMADENIFWEMNVSYDSIHDYKEHEYVLDFFEDNEKQAIVRESGVRLSVGFDGHRVEDYLPDRVKDYCNKITALGIKLAFED